MSKSDNLTDFLTDLADNIRAKTGATGTIDPQNFGTAIANITAESKFYQTSSPAGSTSFSFTCPFIPTHIIMTNIYGAGISSTTEIVSARISRYYDKQYGNNVSSARAICNSFTTTPFVSYGIYEFNMTVSVSKSGDNRTFTINIPSGTLTSSNRLSIQCFQIVNSNYDIYDW